MCVCPLCLVFSQGQYWNESSDSFGSAQPPHTQARAPGAPLQLSPGPSAMSSYIVGVLVSSPASGNGPRTHAVGSCLLDSCLWHVCHRSPALSPADPNRTLWPWFISSSRLSTDQHLAGTGSLTSLLPNINFCRRSKRKGFGSCWRITPQTVWI